MLRNKNKMRPAPDYLYSRWNKRDNWSGAVRSKCNDLADVLKSYESRNTGIALSGGQDSMFLLVIAYCCGLKKMTAYTIQSVLTPFREIKAAADLCGWLGIRHEILHIDVLRIKDVKKNTVGRCYHCKKLIFKEMQHCLGEGSILMDGTNLDDDDDYRPGRNALRELGVLSPLHACGFRKDDIALALKGLDLEWIIRAPSACLATRFPYDTDLSENALQSVDKAETILCELGFEKCRVRVVKNDIRIEVREDQIEMICDARLRKSILKAMHDLGYGRVSVDLAGYRTGSWNEDIDRI